MFKRVLIKISGEALAGEGKMGINPNMLNLIATQIKKIRDHSIDVAIVVGGGNFWRGRSAPSMDRTTADHIGMLATIMNSLALCDCLENNSVITRVQTALNIPSVAEPYIFRKALRHLEKGRVVIFACGTGNPYFSTDTGAALRATEIGANALLMAKNIDGLYNKDPNRFKDAKKFDRLTYLEVINKGLNLMDATSITMCMENNIPIVAFGLNEENSMVKAALGEKIGTLITGEA